MKGTGKIAGDIMNLGQTKNQQTEKEWGEIVRLLSVGIEQDPTTGQWSSTRKPRGTKYKVNAWSKNMGTELRAMLPALASRLFYRGLSVVLWNKLRRRPLDSKKLANSLVEYWNGYSQGWLDRAKQDTK